MAGGEAGVGKPRRPSSQGQYAPPAPTQGPQPSGHASASVEVLTHQACVLHPPPSAASFKIVVGHPESCVILHSPRNRNPQ